MAVDGTGQRIPDAGAGHVARTEDMPPKQDRDGFLRCGLNGYRGYGSAPYPTSPAGSSRSLLPGSPGRPWAAAPDRWPPVQVASVRRDGGSSPRTSGPYGPRAALC
ncbi:hypothetical protein G6F24_016607 [Rhizopus arrhizus]|nr:hypothetical protein G6F24_016607 [Rhizopus arrhizus]